MRKVNICEAMTQLSELVDCAANGEEIVIARSGRPVVKLVPWEEPGSTRRPGGMRGKVRIGRNFDHPLSSQLLDEE